MAEGNLNLLHELQQIDLQIGKIRKEIREFDPRFEEIEEPMLRLEKELGEARSRLDEVKTEERRLERSADDKRARAEKLDERLKSVRNVREESAVKAEQDMVRRAIESDEQEALSLLDQIRRLEGQVEELEEAYQEEVDAVGPRRDELLAQRKEFEDRIESLEADREVVAAQVDDRQLQVYRAIRSGGRDIAVADMTVDGACGNCFSMIPPQLQNEIRGGSRIERCEACGVIIAPPQPEDAKKEAEGSEAADEGVAEEPEASGAVEAQATDEVEATSEAGTAD